MRAGNIGVAAFDFVNEAVIGQKIQCSIDRDRGMPHAIFGHFLNDLISTNGRMPLGYAGKYITALVGQFAASGPTDVLRPRDQVRLAMSVVVIG